MSAHENKVGQSPAGEVFCHNKVDPGTLSVTPAGLDTTRIRLLHDLRGRGLAAITAGREVRPADDDAYVEGFLDNLLVRVRPGSVTIQGSFATLLYGHNVVPAGPEDCKTAAEKLGDILYVSTRAMLDAWVSRLDGAMTAAMPRAVSEYLRTLGDRSRALRRNHREETVAYDVRCRTQHYYDKGLEMRRKKALWRLPEELRDAHLLRYEVQYKRRIKRQFDRRVTVGDLCDPAFHRELKSRVCRLHEEVPKRRVLRLDGPLGTPRLVQRLAAAGIEAVGGVHEILATIADGQTNGSLTRKQASRLRRKVRELAADDALTLQSAAAAELDEAVRRATAT